MTKSLIPFNQYTPTKNGNRSIAEAISEVQREMDTRKRIFDNWCSGGKVSWVDANDRMERIMTALKLLIRYSNELDHAEFLENNPISPPLSSLPVSELDRADEPVAA